MRVLAPSSQISLGMFLFITSTSRKDARALYVLRNMQNPLSRSQREGLHSSDCNARHGRTQIGGILPYEETLRVQVRVFTPSSSQS